jgi:hypothetical protein
MITYYDDNFGHWDIEDEDEMEHYHRTQETNVEKECAGCHRMVMLQPQYGYCNSCATKREQGWDID